VYTTSVMDCLDWMSRCHSVSKSHVQYEWTTNCLNIVWSTIYITQKNKSEQKSDVVHSLYKCTTDKHY